jgi:DNA-binding MarR family transcriptional regulator/GNAT superfamily N-acetyltransferase
LTSSANYLTMATTTAQPTDERPAPSEGRVAAVRAFNRFYTNLIGLLREGLLHTPHSLTEARVIFELGQRDATELADLRRALDIDAGYLSRIIAGLDAQGLLTRERSSADRRRQVIALTKRGREAFRTLDARSAEEVGALLSGLGEEEQRRLLGAMGAIQQLLGETAPPRPFVLRPPASGDYGWIVQRHGAVYADEYGWDEEFEALVAQIVADFAAGHDPKREDAWIAELDGEPAGCVLCTKRDETVAQLRLLLVEPRARGMGIGSRLVEECIRFGRRAGYEELMLWTNHPLEDARRIYERAGFELRDEEPHHSFGKDLVGQDWWLRLQPPASAPG